MQKNAFLRRFGPILGIALLVLVILVAAVLLGLYSRSNKLKSYTSPTNELKASLGEVYLAASGLKNLNNNLADASSAIARLKANLDNGIKTSSDVLSSNKGNLSEESYNQVSLALDGQAALLKNYDKAYTVVGKAISYHPSVDLEKLDLGDSEQRALLAARAAAARDNLGKLTTTQTTGISSSAFELSDTSKNSLNEVVRCFDRLADAAENSAESRDIISTRDECINLYPELRASLVSDLSGVYKTNQATDLLDNLQSLINQL